MPKNIPTAAQRARRLHAEHGGTYTEVLHSLTTPATPPAPPRTDAWLKTILTHLQELGWPASPLDRDGGYYLAYCGPVRLDARRDVDHADADAQDADPDDPRWSGTPLYLGVLAPSEASVDDLSTGARAGDETPKQIATRVDAELAEARLRRVQEAEPESTEPCPICGDRYPQHHLLASSPEGDPVCPACVWDGDQRYQADLPHLAVQLDRLLDQDLSAPAGWAAVAAVLALTCGANLGRRLTRELGERGGWPFVMDRWDLPMDRSWIWLPPQATRHAALTHLGAGASLSAITAALERYDPTLPTQARRVCRNGDVRWRPALWPAAVAYAVAFCTQALERDRHRKPVHLVASTSDGLSQIRKPFGVTGDAVNVESGLEVLLEHLLFPLLLGHGLRNEPRDEPRRVYGAGHDDQRPARSRTDARVSRELDRSAQVAVVLGHVPGVRGAQVIWDGPAEDQAAGAPLGTTSPVNELIDKMRQASRVQAAEQMYDDAGPIAMIADQAWVRSGWWIPADDAPHAVRQARDFLSDRPHVEVLWAGPGGIFDEPVWIAVRVTQASIPGVDPRLRVFDGHSLFAVRLADIALVRRADPECEGVPEPVPSTGTATADCGPLVAEDLSLLIEQYLHLAGHRFGQNWQAVDQTAYATSRQLMAALEDAHRGHFLTTFTMSVNLFDTWHECPSGRARTTPDIGVTGMPYKGWEPNTPERGRDRA